ncbi:hypothetical protein BDN71DRAFT_1433088 [Pleurotus eryngii]|uniref:Uncharacterized protein n=1 Tax=Pleurotus eryngii TaxID=5323 RepID=A0A9P5ZTW3_PLEER|nr:hypothetical protein BDN71DRAFT_1433088 [Pleurotus eryngii]
MMDALASDELDEYGNPLPVWPLKQCHQSSCKEPKSVAKGLTDSLPATGGDAESDNDDYPALIDGSDSEDESDEDISPVMNTEQNNTKDISKDHSEVCKQNQDSHAESGLKASCHVMIEEVDDDGSSLMRNHTVTITSTRQTTLLRHKQGKCNTIYLFFEEVEMDTNSEKLPGTEYFKCYHVLVSKLLLELARHLKSHFPVMYQLYEALRDCNELPTADKLNLACAKIAADCYCWSSNEWPQSTY